MRHVEVLVVLGGDEERCKIENCSERKVEDSVHLSYCQVQCLRNYACKIADTSLFQRDSTSRQFPSYNYIRRSSHFSISSISPHPLSTPLTFTMYAPANPQYEVYRLAARMASALEAFRSQGSRTVEDHRTWARRISDDLVRRNIPLTCY